MRAITRVTNLLKYVCVSNGVEMSSVKTRTDGKLIECCCCIGVNLPEFEAEFELLLLLLVERVEDPIKEDRLCFCFCCEPILGITLGNVNK